IAYAVEGTNGPLFADFHALRHSFIALLDRAGATLKEAMQLARHSDPKLTMARYGRAQLHDLAAKIGELPPLLSGPPATGVVRLAATGTEFPPAEVASLRVACAKTEISGESLTTIENRHERGPASAPGPQTLEMKPFENDCERLTTVDQSSP